MVLSAIIPPPRVYMEDNMQRLSYPYHLWADIIGYKSPAYREYWGYEHYGIDLCTVDPSPLVRASGVGEVLAAGDDDALGFGVAILYRSCMGHDGSLRDLVARYMHLDAIICRVGDKLQPGDAFAREGSQGTKTRHLHLELDMDTRPQYATWSPQVSASGHTLWIKGIDTTFDPAIYLWR